MQTAARASKEMIRSREHRASCRYLEHFCSRAVTAGCCVSQHLHFVPCSFCHEDEGFAAVVMLRSSFLTRAIATVRRLSTRNTGAWTPPQHSEFASPSRNSAPAPAERSEPAHTGRITSNRRHRVICQNWQQYGSCRYGARCAFAEGHVDGNMLRPRSTGQR